MDHLLGFASGHISNSSCRSTGGLQRPMGDLPSSTRVDLETTGAPKICTAYATTYQLGRAESTAKSNDTKCQQNLSDESKTTASGCSTLPLDRIRPDDKKHTNDLPLCTFGHICPTFQHTFAMTLLQPSSEHAASRKGIAGLRASSSHIDYPAKIARSLCSRAISTPCQFTLPHRALQGTMCISLAYPCLHA